jgi:antitoxin (DNA-binding transcriptional repressor) of toxin-antitoxin stability system
MDPIVLVIVLAVGMPVAVVVALAKAAQLRGPAPRKEPRRRVGSLVTEAIPEEQSDDADAEDERPTYSIDSPSPDPDHGRSRR